MRKLAKTSACVGLLMWAACDFDHQGIERHSDASVRFDAESGDPAISSRGDARVVQPDSPERLVDAGDAGDARDARDAGGMLYDGHMAMAVLRLHLNEITLAKLASARAASPDVRHLAETLVRDHTQAVQALLHLVVDTRCITPLSSTLSLQLDGDAERLVAELSRLPLVEFDAHYVASLVEEHEQALVLLEAHQVPGTYDPFLRDHFMKLRADIEAHLALANALLSALDADAGQ